MIFGSEFGRAESAVVSRRLLVTVGRTGKKKKQQLLSEAGEKVNCVVEESLAITLDHTVIMWKIEKIHVDLTKEIFRGNFQKEC